MHRARLYALLFLLFAGGTQAAKPTFENATPVGFSPQDSTVRQNFTVGQQISVRVDLDQAATYDYPIVGNFHNLEQSVQVGATDTDGMQLDVAMVDVVPFGINSEGPAPGLTSTAAHPAVHMAWIEQTTTTPRSTFPYTGGSTPLYRVMYARSFNGGDTFSTPVAVSGNITYHPLTVNGSGSSFSTLDLEVDSGGHPRVAYAFVSTADHERKKNVYFSYSTDGGGTWQTPLVVNDTKVGATESRNAAFPRMVVNDRDNIFISYVRGSNSGGDDIMLAKVNRFSSPFSILPIGETGAAGTGGIRLTVDGDRATGPDLANGDGDALHLVYFNDTGNRIEHKRLATDTTWVDVSTGGWSQDAAGATVSAFVDESTANAALETDATYYFPSVVVDRTQLPDRVYSLFKFGDNTPVESIYFNDYQDAGSVGSAANWGTATALWNTATPALFSDAANNYNIELDWELTERVAAVVDDRLEDRGDLHIAFSAGYSGGGEHDIYYARYNGASWTLPEKVADDDSDATTEDGIAATDVFLLSPALAIHPDSLNVYMGFAGGTGEGFGMGHVTDVNHHAYFKVLGRASTWEDDSVPVGAYQYTLSYTPTNPQTVASSIGNNPVYIHVADPTNGTGLGAKADSSDGFLAGDWETVATTLADDDKFYEGKIDEDSAGTNEWGDDDDKVGLLVKLNVLGSDSSTNIQVITNSTASAAGTGLGARTIRVATDPTGAFVSAGSFFMLSADVDIVASNSGPTVSIAQPDGSGDTANASFAIQYSAVDADDDLGGNLKLSLYAYPTNGLRSVQDIRIFGILVANENDNTSVNVSGTNDLTEGSSQTYTWDDPPSALKSAALFASIQRVPSGNYYIYVVADDERNPPVFSVSSGPLTLRHGPVVQQIDPVVADTVDTGVRTGLKANPYDLDLSVVDYDSEARVQLFYSSISGLTSVSVKGAYPNNKFVLGKSVSGTRATAIMDSTTLTTRDKEFSWDVTSPLVAQGAYYLYAVATDSITTTVGHSSVALVVRHSPAFIFYEPGVDTQRSIDTGSQPIYTIQWQKGPGDKDLDDNASIALYFTTDDPAVKDHSTSSGASSTSLTGDADTELIISGLTEDSDAASDMYVWDLRNPLNAVPKSGARVWLYAVTSDGSGNTMVTRGGSLVLTHNPFVLVKTRLPSISRGDIVRLEWEDYMVDDASGTDDAYLRLYAASNGNHTTLQSIESDLTNGGNDVFILNSSDGTASGTISSLRESTDDAFNWDTTTSAFNMAEGTFAVYAGISADPTFADNITGRLSKASNLLVVGVGSGTTPNLSLSPNKHAATAGDTLTFEVLVQSNGQSIESISAIIDINTGFYTVINTSSPCTDLGDIFTGGTVVENTFSNNAIRFTKNKSGGEIVGATQTQKRLASFQVVLNSGFSGVQSLPFASDAALSITGSATALKQSSGLAVQSAQVQAVARGILRATVLLEGRALGNGDHSTLLDVHLRKPGSTIDITDATFRSANDGYATTTDTVEVQTTAAGELGLTSIPAGRYVLTVKDTSHLSGRSDTLTIRNGEVLAMASGQGFFSSNVRGDQSFLLAQDGRLLKGGDATGDNEVDEDDVNTIDAAWGSNSALANFKQADMNNDGRVGVEDLSLATSNISNSTGFGAPPVFKRASAGQLEDAGVEILAPNYEGEWRFGDEVELVFVARGLVDLTAYEMEWSYERGALEVVGAPNIGDVFAANPRGAFARIDAATGYIAVAQARYGKRWAASGDGELLRVKVRLQEDGFPESLRLRAGRLVGAHYENVDLKLLGDPRLLAVPEEFSLKQNYPNPFNPSTTIPFAVPASLGRSVPTSVEIFNALGQRVKLLVQEVVKPGYHRVVWDGRDAMGKSVGSGLYFYRVQVGQAAQIGKMTLVK
jgi:hypothetical protein